MAEGKTVENRGRIRIVDLKGFLPFGILFGVSLFVYTRTVSPTVNFIDSGELISVSYLLGIAHPTGYPLYTLLGRLFTLAEISPPAVSMNFMSALFGSAASTLTAIVVFLALAIRGNKGKKRPPQGVRYSISLVSGLLFAFSRTMWQVSTETEVYTLAILLFVLILLLSWPLLRQQGRDRSPRGTGLQRTFPAIGYVWGLAMGNHMSIVLLLPMVAYLFYRGRMWEREKWRTIFFSVAAFILGFSIYLYIPVRSVQDPILNWGNPANLESFIRHISAWQYRVWMFSGGTDVFIQKLGDYFLLLSDQFNPFFLFLLLPGGYLLFTRKRSLLIVLVILFLSNLIYSLNYDIPDIDPYFIPSFFVVVVLIAIGVYQVAEWIASKKSALAIPFAAASFLLPLSVLRSNYQVCDRSRDYMAYEFASNFLSTVSKDAVVLTRTWDLYAPVMYLQLIEDRRHDVTMIDYELMRRSWYVEDLLEDHMDLFLPAREEVEVFLGLVADFEEGEPYNSRRLEDAFNNMLNAILLANYPEKPAYVDFDDNPNIAPALKKNPRGLIFQLLEEYDGVSFDRIQFMLNSTLDLTIYRDERALWIRSLYPWYALKEGIALREIERYDEAVKSLEEALFFDPNNTTVLHLLGDSYYQVNSLERAMGCYRRIISITPGDLKARKRLEEIDHTIQGDS